MVLAPSIFFISQAFAANHATLTYDTLEVTGPGKFTLKLKDIVAVEWVEVVPELSGTGGFSLGLVKKGNFIRKSDQVKVRVIKNQETKFIHLTTKGLEVYFNLDDAAETEAVFTELSKLNDLE